MSRAGGGERDGRKAAGGKPGDAKSGKGGTVSGHMAEIIPVKKRVQPSGKAARLEPELQEYIGRELRTIYSGVLNEPVPDRFLELLRKLDSDKAGN